MENEEKIEMLERRAVNMLVVGVFFGLFDMALIFLHLTANLGAIFLVVSFSFMCVSAYYSALIGREKRKVKP